MDRTLRITKALIALALLTCSAQGAQQNAPIDEPITVSLPAGTVLEPDRTYEVELLIGGRREKGVIRLLPLPAGAEPSNAAAATPTDLPANPVPVPNDHELPEPREKDARSSGDSGSVPVLVWVVVAALVAATLCGIVVWYYYARHIPSKETAPYWEALEQIKLEQYRAALPTLTRIEAQLPSELRGDARFFMAFCHFQLDRAHEAERILADLHREAPRNEHVAYLLAYIRVADGHHDEAEPVLEKMESNRQLDHKSARLLGIVKFCRGLSTLQAGEVDSAAEMFAKVEKLGFFVEHIPADLRNRHIVLGTRALFERSPAEAREHFDALAKAVSRIEGEQGQLLMAKAKLGISLALWIESDPARHSELEKMIVETCQAFHPDGPLELPWPEPEPGSAKGSAESLKQALENADKNFDLAPEDQDKKLCLRDLHFLRGIVVLRAWSQMNGQAAHDAIEERLKAALSRFACARAVDERCSDVFLVVGLLLFYLHPPGPERTTGVHLLEEARKLGMRDPDAMEIVNQRERIERENADAVDKYQQVLDRYLKDETVRKEVREALLERLSTHRSLMSRYKPPDLARARTVPPTLQEMTTRSGTLNARIREMGKTARFKDLETLGHRLQQSNEALSQQAHAIEQTESELLARMGEELFKDE